MAGFEHQLVSDEITCPSSKAHAILNRNPTWGVQAPVEGEDYPAVTL